MTKTVHQVLNKKVMDMEATNQLSRLLDKAKEIANGSASEDDKVEDGDEDSNDSDDSFN